MSQDEHTYLSDVIKYDRDIEPYQFIEIFAGVGSGKNTFIDKLVKGGLIKNTDDTLVAKKNVLLVTSRRAKADEQRGSEKVTYDSRVGKFDTIDFDYVFDDGTRNNVESSGTIHLPQLGGLGSTEVPARSCCCTNKQIEYLWEEFDATFANSIPWLRFDIIVVDEVHSLLTDGAYQPAPFYVRRLIEETLRNSTTCKVIIMTGTPETLSDYPFCQEPHKLDYMNVCDNLMPSRIHFINAEQANQMAHDMLVNQQRFIYFANRAAAVIKALDVYSDFGRRIAISFSDEKKRQKLKRDNASAFNCMRDTELHIKAHKELPDNISALFSTSRNKEGINIKNPDIRVVFTEAHVGTDIKQMAGRLRRGVDDLYIITNPQRVPDEEHRLECCFNEESQLVSTVNEYLERLATRGNYPLDTDERELIKTKKELWEYIKYIHIKYDYIRFDYYSNKFCFYPERKLGRAYMEREGKRFAPGDKDILKSLASEWFPHAECSVEAIPPTRNNIQEQLDAYLGEQGWIGESVEINKEQREALHRWLKYITGKRSALKTLLNQYHYKLWISHHDSNRAKIIAEQENDGGI